jgi:hypothetical protein
LDRRLVGLQRRAGDFQKEKNFFSPPGMEAQYFCHTKEKR